MTGWTTEELERIDTTDNVGVASRRTDGSLRRFITIWAVRVGDQVYVRSAYGPDNPWFVRAQASGTGSIKVAGHEHDVAFEVPDAAVDEAVTAAFHAKYHRHPPKSVASVVSADAVRCTLRLLRR